MEVYLSLLGTALVLLAGIRFSRETEAEPCDMEFFLRKRREYQTVRVRQVRPKKEGFPKRRHPRLP